jgi:voltage-gated potassium channel
VPLRAAEWVFTILFTLEYAARLRCTHRPGRHAFSPLGLIDLLAVLPTYLSFFLPGAQSLFAIRSLRLLRIFRIFRLRYYVNEAEILVIALRASRRKITVFLGVVMALVIIVGTLMYLLEGEKNGFTSIPRGIYLAIVTMTTVGYGDFVPHTPLGQMLDSVLMIIGYGVIAVPTGIVSVGNQSRLSRQSRDHSMNQTQDLLPCFTGGTNE